MALTALLVALLVLPGLTPDRNLRAVVPLFVVLLVVQSAPIVWSRRADLFAPPVIFAVTGTFSTIGTLVVFFASGGLNISLLDQLDPPDTLRVAERTLLVLIFGQLAYYAGFYSRFGVGFRDRFPRVAGLVWDRRRVIAIAGVVALAFIITYAAFQGRVGVPLFDVTALAAGKRVWRDDPALSWMIRGVTLGFVPLFLYVTSAVTDRRLTRIIPAGICAVAVALLVLRLGQRGAPAYAFLALVTVAHYLWKRIPVTLFAAVYFIGLGVSNITYQWRTAPETQPRQFQMGELTEDPSRVVSTYESERQRFAVLAVVMNEFPEHHDYLLGESWLAFMSVLIPRWLWPEKGLYFLWRDSAIVYTISGVPAPPPYVGVLYANLSWIGVALGMLAFGAFHRALYEWLKLYPRDRNVVLLYALIVHNFAPTLLAVSACLTSVLPVWIILRVIGRRPRALAPARA
ncbi:MAG TPA: O-antigen polymerase [Haliangiales bacterium]|nr:O-antigen polymerase [Haliangiales bacterium]